MSIKDRLTEDMKQAMKDKEAGKLRLSVIRMVRANIKNVEIDKKKELSEEEVLDVLAKEVKMRRDSMEEFKKGNRPDLVENLEQEIAILMQYLPQQLNEQEVRVLVTEAVKPGGYCVLNADDPWTLKAREKAGGKIILFSLERRNPYINSHIDAGGCAVFIERDV
jgi:uncharacterized protein YqeY